MLIPERFKHWVESRPPKTVIGTAKPYVEHNCPLENYLMDLYGVECFVYGAWYSINGTSYNIPSPLNNFVYSLDSKGKHEVTREEALQVLEGLGI